jgi:LmbE family N-acetylglucosaminyl deacetylase
VLNFHLFEKTPEPKILCLGAHPDDIEIGCGGTILKILDEIPGASFQWIVFSGNQKRITEAQDSARRFLGNAPAKYDFLQFKDSYFPFIGASIKDYFEEIKKIYCPDIIFSHYSKDAHQDHRLISDLTWNTFRDHFIVEYEIPKYDGDLTTPNVYVHLSEKIVSRKISYIISSFESQKEKSWFTEDAFRSLLRIRGIESNASKLYAEGFHCRKIIFS